MKVLVVEDDQELLRLILKYFDSFGYVVEKAKTIKEAKLKVSGHNYDCIILDINLPDGTGFEFLSQNKSIRKDTGVLILSANDTLDDKLTGLDLGADDYLTKPFHLAELNARVKSIVRRKKFEGSSSIDFNEISIDSDSKTVKVNENKLKLTKKEYELLLFLVTNKYKVVTKQSIADHIWGDYMDFPGSFDFIYSHLKNLRKKIMEHGGNDYVQTVYGIGYKFSDEE
jgi:DNA-binding response OmpR family regulator